MRESSSPHEPAAGASSVQGSLGRGAGSHRGRTNAMSINRRGLRTFGRCMFTPPLSIAAHRTAGGPPVFNVFSLTSPVRHAGATERRAIRRAVHTGGIRIGIRRSTHHPRGCRCAARRARAEPVHAFNADAARGVAPSPIGGGAVRPQSNAAVRRVPRLPCRRRQAARVR